MVRWLQKNTIVTAVVFYSIMALSAWTANAIYGSMNPVEGFGVTYELDLESNVLEQAYTELAKNERLFNILEC